MTPTSRYLICAGREIHFTEWGSDDAEAVIMWHGLARTGRDFDFIARHLAGRYRVICPDTLGRGLSQWAEDADAEYSFRSYGETALDLCRQLGIDEMKWVGTSMGGLVGVTLASGLLKGRITHLLLNDIGPDVQPTAVERIVSYVGNPPTFATYSEFETWIRTVYAPFGEHPDAVWRHLTETSCRRTNEGKITAHYDPKIVNQFTANAGDLDVWDAYDAVECRTLLLRGENSDVISPQTANAMAQRGPQARLVQIDGCGHAPLLNLPDQQRIVDEFLAG